MLRIYPVSIILSLMVLIQNTSIAQETTFIQSNCAVIYSLKRSAHKYFNDEIVQLSTQVNKRNIHFIDLNNWGKSPPHIEISGRLRQQLRQHFNLSKRVNLAILVNKDGKVLSRYSGSVTLVNALIDCNNLVLKKLSPLYRSSKITPHNQLR